MSDHTPDPTEPNDPADRINDALVSAVNDAFDADPIPAEVTQFAFDAFSWRVIDDELAAVTFDSAATELVGIRGTSTQRHTVQFEGRGIAVSVVLSDASLVASLDPAGIHRCQIEGLHGAIEAFSDEDGEFVIDHPGLPLRVVVETDAGRVVSPWITA